jgi:G:T/U-mismatch repair DNA glycosylase/ADP-ribose pyrophosphatase YjhB (NUDIX family)
VLCPHLPRLGPHRDRHEVRAAPAAVRPSGHGRGSAPRSRGTPRRPILRARSGIAPPTPSSAPGGDVPDVLAPGLRVVFCGINPGRVSAAAAAHFANPRNDFWRLLHAAGFTSRLYAPAEQFELLHEGIGVTNAAYRTTPGSGDLRRGDFDADRIGRIAREYAPHWLGFVGKEAYRGLFGERPELGVQERRLGETQLFVLPSTSPANAAVPWHERLRWFQELAGRASGLPVRQGVRALVLDETGRALLVRFEDTFGTWWSTPGGGVEAGESDAHALERELAEEVGLHDYELGPQIWTRMHWFVNPMRWAGQSERHYLVRVPHFEPKPAFTAAELLAEGVHETRWFTPDEMEEVVTGPRRLADLVRALVVDGPPPAPLDAGV